MLLDQEKRVIHDMKCAALVSRTAAPYHLPKQPNSTSSYTAFLSRTAASYHPPKQRNSTSSYVPQHNFRSNTTSSFVGINPQPQQQSQSGFSIGLQTFWTERAFCKWRSQHYREMKNSYLHCQHCQKSFMACKVKAPSAPQSAIPQWKDVQNQGANRKEVGCKDYITAPKPVVPQDVQNQGACRGEVGYDGNLGSAKGNSAKRKRKPIEESESSEIGSSSSDSEEELVYEENMTRLNVGSSVEQNVRRSTRQKQNVSYTENLSDDDHLVTVYATEEETKDAAKEVGRMKTQACLATNVNNQKEVNQKENTYFEETLLNENNKSKNANGKEKLGEKDGNRISEADSQCTPSSSKIPDPVIYVYPDPDFNDFDKDRQDEHFAVDQIWAIYDSNDGMPRFYARIRKILSPGFNMLITWLEPNPYGNIEVEWVGGELPFSCGMFINGNSELTKDHLMFSHLIGCEKGTSRCTYKIYPRKGETWALFKNWDINWKSDPDCSLEYKYEFVVILSEFVEDGGACVAYLGKIRGFVSLFSWIVRDGSETFHIPPSELLRFSHRVPSFKMTGEERKDVPKGSFELDPAALPTSIEEIDVDPENLNVEIDDVLPKDTCLRSLHEVQTLMGNEKGKSAHQADGKKANVKPKERSDSSSEDIEIPDQEFYNFDMDKSQELFQAGQLWALYIGEEGLPKYYCQIVKIDSFPEFRVRIKWLRSCPRSKDNITWWHDKEMPICCGTFKVIATGTTYTYTNSFSHQVKTEPTGKKNEYSIFPRTNQVWALYKNWSAGMRCSELNNCEYDIVEILEENSLQIRVLLLERVEGFKTVFRAQLKGGSRVTLEIYQVDLVRFSHQIPAFKLTEEGGGSLRGSWELDAAALPLNFF